MPDWRNRIIRGDVFAGLAEIPDGVVQAVVTSPPYWKLRSYLPEDHPDKHLELGNEDTPQEYVEHMVAVFREVRRVLRDDGTVWVNVGDSFAGGGRNAGNALERTTAKQRSNIHSMTASRSPIPPGLKPKDLCGIPWRLALALQADGWYLRSDVIWHKLSPMPGSVSGWRWERCRVKVKGKWGPDNPHPSTGRDGGRAQFGEHSGYKVKHEAVWRDCPGCSKCTPHGGYVLRKGSWRCTSAHEYLFMLAKSECYYGDRDAVAEPLKCPDAADGTRTFGGVNKHGANAKHGDRTTGGVYNSEPSGANKRDVWTLSNQPRSEAHFAAFPDSLVEPCILSSTSAKGCCPKCGMPWARVVDSERKPTRPGEKPKQDLTGLANRDPERHCTETRTIGWRPCCNCNAGDPVPSVVLDPFMGRGTVAIVAKRLGRDFVGVELNPDYAAMAEENLRAACPLLMEAQ